MIETRVVVLIMCCAVLYPCLSLGLGVESIVLAEYVYIYIYIYHLPCAEIFGV